jgi:hypothetical protein
MKHKKFDLKTAVLFNYSNKGNSNQKLKKSDDPTLTLATITATQVVLNR